MNEIHRVDMVEMDRLLAVSPQLRFDPALGNLVAELKVRLLVKTIDSLRSDRPAVTLQQDMHAMITVAHTRLADVLDLQHGAGAPDRDITVCLYRVDKFALAGLS